MRTAKVSRYYAECGKGFWKKQQCVDHDKTCKCWTNPRNKACKTCVYASLQPDEPDVGISSYWECNNQKNTNDGHVNDLEKVDYISVNCQFWEGAD